MTTAVTTATASSTPAWLTTLTGVLKTVVNSTAIAPSADRLNNRADRQGEP